jgi:hypothetical protein
MSEEAGYYPCFFALFIYNLFILPYTWVYGLSTPGCTVRVHPGVKMLSIRVY